MKMVLSREKQELRQKLGNLLLSLTKEEIKRRSKNVGDKLASLSIYREAKIVMAYFPLKGEVDIMEMIRKAGNKRFCFPVMDLKEKTLRVFEVRDFDEDFVQGPLGVMEPDSNKTKEVEIEDIDVVVVPGIAFDWQKNRLGRGAGFYDHFLQKIIPSTKKVGVAFDFQVLESLPVYLPLDQKVDIIVSENRVI